MMKRILFGIVILLALGGVAFIFYSRNEVALSFRTEKVTTGDIVSTVTATGTVNAVTMGPCRNSGVRDYKGYLCGLQLSCQQGTGDSPDRPRHI